MQPEHNAKIEVSLLETKTRLVEIETGSVEKQLAKVRMMYWKEIPVQVQAQDENGQVSKPLDARFQEAADAIAMFDGSAGTDSYLDSWSTSEFVEQDGSAAEVADSVSSKFNENMPADLVARIRDMQKKGDRNEKAGAINSWAGVDLFLAE